ncbi:MAG: MFS transporter, partial [Anaerolineae bacterium]|nr:MFS transporter [Phycisphaerae bacterium]
MSRLIEDPPRIGGDGPARRRRSPYRAMSLVTLAWVFGSVWMTATSGAPLTQFARSLGASNFQFGLLAALPFIASLLSLPASVLIDRTGKRKKIFLWGLYAQRILWLPIALAPLWMIHSRGASAAPAALVLSLWLIFIMHAVSAIGSPAWVSWMADLVPERVRGKYFSRRRQWGILSAIPAAWIAGWLLDRPEVTQASNASFVTLTWCAVIFLCSAVFGIVDIAMFHWVDEIPAQPHPRTSLFKSFAQPLKNRSFLWFGGFVATLTFAVSFMGQFLTLFLIEKLHISNRSTQMMLLIAPMLAQLVTLPAWGVAVDRFGKRPVLAISALALVPVAFGWCLMNGSNHATALWIGYALAAAGAALWAGVEVANFNLVLEFSGSDEHGAPGTSYVAVNSVIINLAGCAGGLASGFVAQSLKNWAWDTGIGWLGT